MRIDSGKSAAIVSAWYSPNVALFCGGKMNKGFSRYICNDFISNTMYERRRRIDFNEIIFEIKRKQ